MRHRRNRHKLSRDAAHRKALLRNLSKQLIEHERIRTSQAKAKAVKPEVEKLITLAKRGDLHARRQLLSKLGQDKFTVHKLVEEIAPRYDGAPGRLHADRQARPAPQRLDRDGLPRAGLTASERRCRRPPRLACKARGALCVLGLDAPRLVRSRGAGRPGGRRSARRPTGVAR